MKYSVLIRRAVKFLSLSMLSVINHSIFFCTRSMFQAETAFRALNRENCSSPFKCCRTRFSFYSLSLLRKFRFCINLLYSSFFCSGLFHCSLFSDLNSHQHNGLLCSAISTNLVRSNSRGYLRKSHWKSPVFLSVQRICSEIQGVSGAAACCWYSFCLQNCSHQSW